ncbi:hypothetical protein [Staphylococcus shinii]|uniref:hypothetical protein n=1 Tax=Staphylococcus shinii TaxID=2912228 RepID=UPI003F54C439
MFKSKTNIIENDKYKVEQMDLYYLKRTQKNNEEERYFCIAQSYRLTLEALEYYVKSSKAVMNQLGKENVRATLEDTGNGIYQATIIYFDDSLSGLKEATENLELLKSNKAINLILKKE